MNSYIKQLAIQGASIPLKRQQKEKNAKYDNKIKKRFLPRVRRFLLNFFFGSKRNWFRSHFPISKENENERHTLASNAKPSNNFWTLRGPSALCKGKVVDTTMWIACSSSSPILCAGSFTPGQRWQNDNFSKLLIGFVVNQM
jgi:hypothetical protein